MYSNLKTLIKAIRATKTLADERAVITKESASIRTSFKEEDSFMRHHNVAKLLYIHMLGYPAHFGQIECLKLVASPRFSDKRLGYLGIGLLLDEKTEVLTLVTNSLKNDMNHSNMYIVGLALCTFANIASEEMSRDLVNEIEKLIGSSNTYIRRKASLCALRVIHKVPELQDHFVGRANGLLQDRNHGVLLCGVTLVTDMCAMHEAGVGALDEFRKTVPLLVRHLKALVTTGYSPEHDVSGITDPFLQVKILRLLRVLGNGSSEASETMNDILAQVATNTESAKNVGNAILYEAVLTILDIEAEQGLRVMAINILGKFLGNKDNNIRYVALNTLNKVVAIDTQAVQRHRTIILDCLRDGDISIRRRALELSYALINDGNVRVMTRELLTFLEVADAEFKLGLTTQISLAAERFAPNRRWHIDTVLRVLKLAGNYVREEVLSAFIRLVAHTPELQSYTVSKLYSSLRSDISQESLTLAAVWTIGEYSDVLLSSGGLSDDDTPLSISASELLDLLQTIADSPYTNSLIRQFLVTALAKVYARLDGESGMEEARAKGRVREMLDAFGTSGEVEIQQRAVEFAVLLADGRFEGVRKGVLERMPPPELRPTVLGTVSEKRAVGSTSAGVGGAKAGGGGGDANLLDLLGDEGASSAPAGSSSSSGPTGRQATQDLLADIFGSSDPSDPSSSSPAPSAPAPAPRSTASDILGLFDSPSASSPTSTAPAPAAAPSDLFSAPAAPQPQPPPAQPQQHAAYEAHGLSVTLAFARDRNNPSHINVLARFTAKGEGGIHGLNFQVAVPKTQKLQMLASSSQDVKVGETETQQMRILAQPNANVRLRLRLAFTSNEGQQQDQTDFTYPGTI